MSNHITQNWIVRKPVVASRGGVVASQCLDAARVGAQMLTDGGNAIDAAVAAGFALTAIEPWNSGLGGIGYMLVYLARERRVQVVDFSPISPRGIDPADFPMTGGFTTELFTWPTVKDDRNIHGPLSFAVPGDVDGLGLALERFGTRSIAEAIRPAIALAREGLPIDWFLTLKVGSMARDLARYPSTRGIWLPQGFPPTTGYGQLLQRLQLAGLAQTLERLSRAGRRDFYEGEIAASIVRDDKALGGVLRAEDLQHYQARIVAPLETSYRGMSVALAPSLTGGPSMAQVLERLGTMHFTPNGPHTDAFVAYARALREAYEVRLTKMGEASDHRDPACTTHLNVVDRDGNMVALTKTLLSVFGSKVVLPETGILMNNGMMWFDPRPGTPNSLAPGKRPLTNMCPVIVRRGGQPWFAIGGSGGRKIFPAVLQVSSFLIDHGMSLEAAFHQPRIDVSGGDKVGLDPRLPADVQQAIGAFAATQHTEHVVYPTNFACPSAVLRDPKSGECFGMSDVMSPWSGSAGVAT